MFVDPNPASPSIPSLTPSTIPPSMPKHRPQHPTLEHPLGRTYKSPSPNPQPIVSVVVRGEEDGSAPPISAVNTDTKLLRLSFCFDGAFQWAKGLLSNETFLNSEIFA